MEWTTLIAAALGGAVAVITAVVTNGFQLRRDRAARDHERDQVAEQYRRAHLEAVHERVRADAMAVMEAVANAERLVGLVISRNGGSTPMAGETARFLNEDELAEWHGWVAKGVTSARNLELIDETLGEASRALVLELYSSSPGEPIRGTADNALRGAVRTYLNNTPGQSA